MPSVECEVADPENQNQDRSGWAEAGLRAFAEQTGQDPETDGWLEIAKDFVADLAHFCDRHGLQLDNLVSSAAPHYEAETDPDEDETPGKVHGTQFDGLE